MSLMITRMIAVLLSLSLLINPCMAQESLIEDNLETSFTPDFTWEPGRNETSLGDFELVVYIMPVAKMETPHAGYLLYRTDWIEIKRRMDNWLEEINRIKSAEREICNGLLSQKDADCQQLNSELRLQLDTQTTQITQLNTNVTELKTDVLTWKIVAGVTGVLALSAGIYSAVK